MQRISVDGAISDTFALDCSVLQGSCLGPLLFLIYTSKLFEILSSHLPSDGACICLRYSAINVIQTI